MARRQPGSSRGGKPKGFPFHNVIAAVRKANQDYVDRHMKMLGDVENARETVEKYIRPSNRSR